MRVKVWMLLAVLIGNLALGACAPLVGAGAVVAADEIKEQEDGGDGLF